MKDYPNREALRKAHDIYRDAMRQFIVRCLKRVRGERIEDLICNSLDGREKEQFKQNLQQYKSSEASIDIDDFPKIIKRCWSRDRAFKQEFDPNSKIQYKTGTIVESRNSWAHPRLGDIDPEHTRANLTHVAEVLGEIKNQDAKQAVEFIRDQLFSDEPEVHPLEAENAAYKERLADMTKQLEAAKAEKTELEKQVKTTSDRLEEVEAEWIASEERLETVSVRLKTTTAGKTAAEECLSDTSNRLEDAEVKKAELEKCLKTMSDQLKDVEAENAAYKKRIEKLEETNTEKTKSKPTATEKFRAENTLENRKEIGRKVAELRINSAGSKGMAWAKIRAKLGLQNDEFHKVIRLEDHFQESVVERIESFEDGWEYKGKLKVLLGFEPVGELANRIEACKPTPKLEPKEDLQVEQPPEHLLPNANLPDSITFKETTFTRHLDEYHVAGNDITQSFWDYWHSQGHEGKQEMRDAGWSVEKVDGVWEVVISPEDFEAWIAEDGEPSVPPIPPSDEIVSLPTGKEMEQPVLEFLSDGEEARRVEIIDFLTEHFSLTDDARRYLSKTGQMEKSLMNKGLIDRPRTGYYQITDRGFETLHPKNTAQPRKSQRKWRRPGAVAALRDPAEIREAEAKIARILNPSEKSRLERELRKAKQSVDSS